MSADEPTTDRQPNYPARSAVAVTSTKGVRSFRVQLVQGVTAEEVDRLVALALEAERKMKAAEAKVP
jgi:hypothetical protein